MLRKKGKLNKKTGQLACPKCGCTTLSMQKKGFGLLKGAAGVAVAGPVGAVAAGIGKNKVKVTCVHCGYRWTV